MKLTSKQVQFLEFLKLEPFATENFLLKHFGYKSRRSIQQRIQSLRKRKVLSGGQFKKKPWKVKLI